MKEELSDTELDTYSRQVVLEDIGYDGQLKIRNARACIVGMGGLGSLIALKLVAMGIGHLRIVDRDIVSRSDLHRQYLYDTDSVGLPKVEVAHRKLRRLNPDVDLDAISESLNSANANEMIAGVDVVLDGLDRPEPRCLVNRTCNELKISYIFGAAIEAYGNLSTILPGRTVCLECFMPGLEDVDMPKCGVVGVHPSVLGIVTSLQVSEAVRLIIGQEPLLLNKLMLIDLRQMQFHTISMDKDKLRDCSVCGEAPTGPPQPLEDKFFEETCARDGRRNFIISPGERVVINLEELSKIIDQRGFRVKIAGVLGITFELAEDVTVSILKSGTMIAQTPPGLKGDPRDKIIDIYKSLLVCSLGLSPTILRKL